MKHVGIRTDGRTDGHDPNYALISCISCIAGTLHTPKQTNTYVALLRPISSICLDPEYSLLQVSLISNQWCHPFENCYYGGKNCKLQIPVPPFTCLSFHGAKHKTVTIIYNIYMFFLFIFRRDRIQRNENPQSYLLCIALLTVKMERSERVLLPVFWCPLPVPKSSHGNRGDVTFSFTSSGETEY
jgi:hypothetical protein